MRKARNCPPPQGSVGTPATQLRTPRRPLPIPLFQAYARSRLAAKRPRNASIALRFAINGSEQIGPNDREQVLSEQVCRASPNTAHLSRGRERATHH